MGPLNEPLSFGGLLDFMEGVSGFLNSVSHPDSSGLTSEFVYLIRRDNVLAPALLYLQYD